MKRHQGSFLLIAVALFSIVFASGCALRLTTTPDDIPETVTLTALCEAQKAGAFTFELGDGDGTLSPPEGQPIPATGAPFRATTTFTPNQTGRSRAGAINCRHSARHANNPATAWLTVREKVSPTIVAFAPPPAMRVGVETLVRLHAADDPTGPGEGVASGFDQIHVNTTGALSGPGVIDLAGVPPGPPDQLQGPLVYNQDIVLVCRREGEGSVRIYAQDAARNDVYSPIHNVRCLAD